MRRRRGGDLQRRPGGVKRQSDRSGVELERLPTLGIPISEIANDRAAERRAMDAELMRTAGARPQLKPGAAAVRTEEAIIGHRPLPRWIDDHAPAAAASEFLEPALDPASSLRWLAFDHGPIDLFDEPAGKQRAEAAQRLWMPTEDEAAAGITIEPMGKVRRIRQAKAQFIEAAFEIATTAGTGMDRDPRGLVDDQNETVTIEDAVRQRTSDWVRPRRKLRLYLYQGYSAALRKGSRKRSRSASHSSAPKRRNISGTVISLIGGG